VQRFDVFEQENSFFTTCNQARRRRIQSAARAFDLGHQRGNTGFARGALGPGQGGARLFRPQAPYRDSGHHEFVGCSPGWREEPGVEIREQTLRVVETSDEQQSPDLEIARMSGVQVVAVCFERCARGVEHPRRPTKVARGKGDLGLGDDTPGARHAFFGTKCTVSTFQEVFGAQKIAELRHCDAAQRESWGIVAQRDSL
jgi:hypothetical protein